MHHKFSTDCNLGSEKYCSEDIFKTCPVWKGQLRPSAWHGS